MAPIELFIPSGEHLCSQKQKEVRRIRINWKEKRTGLNYNSKESMPKTVNNNKQYIHVFSGGMVRLR
jgi:hypothetical protein